MNPGRHNKIVAYVDHLRRAYGIERVPTDVDRLIAELGGRSSDGTADMEIRGCGPDAFQITLRTVNEQERTPPRRRLAQAHALGHLFLHMGFASPRWQPAAVFVDTARRCFGTGERVAADTFAYALLAPPDAFCRTARAHRQENGTFLIQPIADAFGMPVEAARAWGRTLDLFAWS